MLLDPRNGPRWDLHTTEQNRRSYVVASTPRTGSTLLCRTLWGTGLVGAPKEYLNPMQLRDWEVRLGSPWSSLRHRALGGMSLGLVTRGRWDHQRIAQHLDRVKQRRTASSGWFGMKLHAHCVNASADGSTRRISAISQSPGERKSSPDGSKFGLYSRSSE